MVAAEHVQHRVAAEVAVLLQGGRRMPGLPLAESQRRGDLGDDARATGVYHGELRAPGPQPSKERRERFSHDHEDLAAGPCGELVGRPDEGLPPARACRRREGDTGHVRSQTERLDEVDVQARHRERGGVAGDDGIDVTGGEARRLQRTAGGVHGHLAGVRERRPVAVLDSGVLDDLRQRAAEIPRGNAAALHRPQERPQSWMLRHTSADLGADLLRGDLVAGHHRDRFRDVYGHSSSRSSPSHAAPAGISLSLTAHDQLIDLARLSQGTPRISGNDAEMAQYFPTRRRHKAERG